jgi:hypothetical protein
MYTVVHPDSGILFSVKKEMSSQVWWSMPVIPALEGLRQKGHEFQASLGNIVRQCLKQRNRQMEMNYQAMKRQGRNLSAYY